MMTFTMISTMVNVSPNKIVRCTSTMKIESHGRSRKWNKKHGNWRFYSLIKVGEPGVSG